VHPMIPNVRTIPPGAPFLRTLVAACMDGSLGVRFPAESRDYSAATIYVPTRRAARALAHAFAEALQPSAVLLPRIVPLGDPADLEERAIVDPVAYGGADDGELAPATGDLDRRLLLARMIETWRNSRDLAQLAAAGDGFLIAGGFADSFALAGDLAGVMDEFTIESVEWERIRDLTEGRFDQFWALTRSFLEIAWREWPAVMAQRGALDPTDRLNRLLRREAARLVRERPDRPIIAAGSTGTVPATAELLAAIARSPNGAVVLPGLDLEADARGWDLVPQEAKLPHEARFPHEAKRSVEGRGENQHGHPQAALKRLLGRLGIARGDVGEIGAPPEALRLRARVVNAASRPAEATDDWPELRGALAEAMRRGLADVGVVEAPDERLEALAVAIALRSALVDGDGTAALVTPDRALAQRVAAELRRWGVTADDSAGAPLSGAPLGAFARLVAEAVAADVPPSCAMALLAHPCLGLGDEDAVAALELAGFRGADVGAGLDGVARALDEAEARIDDRRSPRPVRRIGGGRLAAARALLADFVAALRPLADLAEGAHPLPPLARAHAAAVDRLAGDRAASGADALGLGRVFDRLAAVDVATSLSFRDYAALFASLAAEEAIAPAEPVQGRIKIWGLLEARLMEADLVVLGGLNEGVWPPDVRTDPFLNRTMRAELGLAAPERRIGQSAHEFAQALGAPKAVIVRARTVEGTPMVASRFLRRLDAFVGADAAEAMRANGRLLLDAAAALDDADFQPSIARPDPKPPAALQPSSLSITEISTLFRDPYAIYACHVLGLDPLGPLESGVDARDRGAIVHDILARFVKETQSSWPAQPLALLLDHGRAAFEPYARIEAVAAFWWPVFEKVARWFVAWEGARRAGVAHAEVETSGAMSLALADGSIFKLRGRADRIDVLADGRLAIVDYKTGQPPSAPEVASGLEPQLTLTAHMAAAGLFAGVPAGAVGELVYVRVGSTPKDVVLKLKTKNGPPLSIEEAANRHIHGLRNALDRLRSGEDGFLSRRMPRYVRDDGPYDHLARVREWMVGDLE